MKKKCCILLIPSALTLLFMMSCQMEKKLVPGEGTMLVGGFETWYRIVGEGEKTPLVMLHGGPGAPSFYLNPLSGLGDERPVIFFDQPGGGRSASIEDMGKLGVDFFVEHLEAFRKALGIKQFYLYGQSWGSALAIEYYLKYPDGIDALILSSPLISSEKWIADTDYLITKLPGEIQEDIRLHEAQKTYDSPEYQQAIMAFYEQYVARKLPWSADIDSTFAYLGTDVYMHMWGPSEFTVTGLLKDFDRTGALGDIQVPVLYITGEYDEARPETVQYFQSLTPGAHYAEIGGAAHLTMQDEPEENISVIREFLHYLESQK